MPNVRNLLNTITPGEVVEVGDSNRQDDRKIAQIMLSVDRAFAPN